MQKDTIFTLIKNLGDEKSLEVRRKIDKIAPLNTNVLVYGETGVGKDFWVDYLFAVSGFPKLLNLNCGDVPENLLESEWFGYQKGAFTGAERDYEGKWKQAEKGILFLNQVDLLSLNVQSRLLRIIERKKYFPLGSNREVEIDVRFVFSTDADIVEKVRRGEFRQDLYYRISAYQVPIPPLRERAKDILPLVTYFAGEKDMEVNLSAEGKRMLSNYHWDGNIREVENFVNSISIMKGEINDEAVGGLLQDRGDFLETHRDPELSLEELEKQYIYYLLRKYKSKTRVCEILDISRKALYNKLKRYEED